MEARAVDSENRQAKPAPCAARREDANCCRWHARAGAGLAWCRQWLGVVLALALAGNVGGAGAAGVAHAAAAVHVPAALDDWREWVLHGHEDRRCPFLYNSGAVDSSDFLCAWPGTLQVTAGRGEGTFEQTWTVYGEQWVPLPGDAEIWPRQVTRDDQPVSVVLRDNVPSVRLDAGEHRLAGRFVWRERPAALPVAAQVGLVALTVDGERVAVPRRENGLWLAVANAQRKVQDTLSVDIYRRVFDDVPTRLETVFAIDVSGSVREERLAPALPEGFVPLTMSGDLPARLAANGDLIIQVRPGDWELSILARASGAAATAPAVLDSIVMPSAEHNMPATEIWSYQAIPSLRTAMPEGGRPVAPALVGAPWLELPAFQLRGGERFVIDERHRGQAQARNELALQRQLWLDFDGGGFTFADDISGTMRTDWRLDMVPPYALLAAKDDGQALVVTRNDALPDSTGMEVRSRDLKLEALGRIESRGAVPVAGWLANMDVGATLNVPPGGKLLAAFGVDNAPDSWIGRWRLLDFFVLLIVAVAAARLFGRLFGTVALLALTLSYHEALAPVWTWLNLLAAVALARVAPEGRLQRLARSYRLASFAVLLLFLIPFAITQIRIAVYPQLEPAGHRYAQTAGLFEMLAGTDASPAPDLQQGDAYAVTGSYIRRADFERDGAVQDDDEQAEGRGLMEEVAVADIHPRYDAVALTPTGPGRPAWRWTPYELNWHGPVTADRTMRLLVAAPWLTGLLRLLAVAALGVFAARFAWEILGKTWRWPSWRRSSGKAGTAAAAALVLAALVVQPASAETPSAALLEDLQERLLAPPSCAPACAEVVAATVQAGADELSIALRVHALAAVAVPLPGAVDGWHPSTVLRGDAALPVQRRQNALWVRVDAGRHELTARGPLPDAQTVEIPFAAPPRAVEAHSEHWFVDGIRDGILPGGSLVLTRLRPETAQAPVDWQASRFPAFLRIERTLHLEPNDWRVLTVARRLAPAVGVIDLDVPLLPGEAVVSDGFDTRDGRVRLALQPTQRLAQWRSSLPQRPALALAAPLDQPWQEVWRLHVNSAWRVTFAGLPPSQPAALALPQSAAAEAFGSMPPTADALTFHPRPGETLTLTIDRPPALPGATIAFDGAKLETTAGARRRESTLELSYRSTRGGSHEIRLPENAELGAVTVDGAAEPLLLSDGVLNVPILPGEHRLAIAWQEAAEVGLRAQAPSVELGAAASNIVTGLRLPSRWLLFADGPPLGPAILYWSELIALVVASLILGRVGFTPLRTHHWLLLGLGFSTFSWLAFAIVAVWLLAHGTRKLWADGRSRLIYNVSQIGFGVLTLSAFAAILAGIPNGLLGDPDMSVTGFGSSGQHLLWFADRTAGALPPVSVWSLPLWTYKALILVWALWLSFALVRWLPWIWQCFSARGLWLPKANP